MFKPNIGRRINSKKINYMTYIKQKNNKECNQAILRIFNNIKIEEIEDFINKIECISKDRKNLYIKIINIRYKIIAKVYNSIKV